MKYCTKCGKEIMDEAVVCPYCGCSTETNKPSETNSMAIAGFICSFFIPLLGFIFGVLGLKKSQESKSGKEFSIAAIVISAMSLIIYICLISFIASSIGQL